MSEEEIYDEIIFCNEGEYITKEREEAIKALWNLYEKEKEKNKELQERLSEIYRKQQYCDLEAINPQLYYFLIRGGIKLDDKWLDEIVKCRWCKQPVRDGDRIWLDGDCLCPQCYQHKRHKYYDKEEE